MGVGFSKDLLAAKPGTHPALVQLFVQAAQDLHHEAGWFQRKGEFIGLGNYERMLSDDIWLEALGNSVKGMLLLPVFILLPLVVAFALFTRIRGWRMHRAVYLLSYLLPAAMAGVR